MKSTFDLYRPEEYYGVGDRYLHPLIDKLIKILTRLEKKYTYDTLVFENKEYYQMASLLIEFAEDLHNDIGLWNSIENYNQSMFGTPLPLFLNKNEKIAECFDINRIKYFIYTILYEFSDDLILSPKHNDLDILAAGVSDFLKSSFENVPKSSGVKKYLSMPNKFGWDVKRKLVWAGINSFLFRFSCIRYVNKNNNGKMEVAVIDDFICQENTIWSGLGIIDILSKVIDLPQNLEDDVRSWYLRLYSFYLVLSEQNYVLEIENIINNQVYKVQLDSNQENVFKTGDYVLGGIVPFGNYYYWSGTQQIFQEIENSKIAKFKNDFIQNSPKIVYRYEKSLLEKALKSTKEHYEEFKHFFGDDMATFKDGLSMAAALQKTDKLSSPFPYLNLSEKFIDVNDGIGLFFHQGEGIEIMTGFENILNGFRKKGIDLNDDESEAILRFVRSDVISPDFVNKLVREYGHKSIAASFLLDLEFDNTDFLLHKYKGRYYRTIFPNISFRIE